MPCTTRGGPCSAELTVQVGGTCKGRAIPSLHGGWSAATSLWCGQGPPIPAKHLSLSHPSLGAERFFLLCNYTSELIITHLERRFSHVSLSLAFTGLLSPNTNPHTPGSGARAEWDPSEGKLCKSLCEATAHDKMKASICSDLHLKQSRGPLVFIPRDPDGVIAAL